MNTPSNNRIKLVAGAGIALLSLFFGSTASAQTANTTTTTTSTPALTCDTIGTNAFTGCYYDNQDFTSLKITRTDSVVDFGFGTGSPDSSIAPDTFSARWQGNLTFEGSPYEFTAVTDDGMRVYIDGELILDKFFDQPPTTHKVTKTLSAGTHTVKVEYYENTGESVARLSWMKTTTTPPLNCSTTGTSTFTGCYYDTKDFDALKIVRTDTAINFDFGTGSPDPSIGSDTFSARWQGNFPFDASTYEFTAVTDDGMRVFIDGTLVLDKFFDQPPTTHIFSHTMSQGAHDIKVEYYENGGDAVAKLSWKKTTTTPPLTCGTVGTNAFTGCYYDNQDFTALKTVRTDTAVNFDFGTGSPDPMIAPDTFSARWEGNFTFEAAQYNFTATTDDGMRVYIDDALVLDKFFDQPPTTHTFSRTLTAGTHKIKVDYYEHGGDAVAKLGWMKVATSGLHILTPLDGSTVSGMTEVKAVFEGRNLNTYTIDWRTEGGSYTALIDDPSGMYKHNFIDFGPWNWRADKKYPLEFRARDLSGAVIGNRTITVQVNN